MNSIDTHFSTNVFEAVQKTRSTCFIGSKTIRLPLVVLSPIKRYFNHKPHAKLSHGCIFHLDKVEALEYLRGVFSYEVTPSLNESGWKPGS